MAKMNKGVVALVAAGVAVVGYEYFFGSTHVPAGYAGVTVAPGLLNESIAPVAGQVAGQYAFILPTGAKWSAGVTGIVNGTVGETAVTVPTGSNSPFLITGAGSGTGYILTWIDASGVTQTTAVSFA
jgi:hypothetical protein